jgi:glycosyltransferase involved in cell wall biosynthesis
LTAERRTRRLITVGHSYVVGLNRRLAHELTREGRGRWEVLAVAPKKFYGDLRPLHFHPEAGEPCRVTPVPALLTKKVHIMIYGFQLRHLLRGEPWDVVHCWEEPYVLAGGQVAHWVSRNAALVYYTCQNLPKRYPPPFSWIERFAVDRCSGWIAMGQTVAEVQRSRGYGRRPHRVLTPGVDTSRFRPDRAVGLAVRHRLGWEAKGPPVVGFLGRLVSEKGLDVLTRALDDQTVSWRALFVGTGPKEAALREWAGRRGGGNRVAIVTNAGHDEVPAYLNAMDILAAPSQSTPYWREQFGRMLIEAFACGVPVIASNSGEIPYVVADAGLIIDEADRAGWADGIASLLGDSYLRADMARRGLERVQAHFTWPVIACRHLQFFEELMSLGSSQIDPNRPRSG